MMFKRRKKPQTTDQLVSEILSGKISVPEAQKRVDTSKLVMELGSTETEARNKSNIVDLRKMWGRVILGILVVTIVGDFILVWKVGTGQWGFVDHGWFLNVVATEHLVQIFGLVLIVLKALFPGHE